MTDTEITWRGSKDVHEQPGSPRWTIQANRTEVVRIFRGPYQYLFETKPKIGERLYAYPRIKVERVDIQPDAAGATGPGTLTVTYGRDAEDFDGTEEDDETLEIEWGSLEKRIETHPRYNNGAISPWADEEDMSSTFEMKTSHEEVSFAEFWDRWKGAGMTERKKLRGEIPTDRPALMEMLDDLAGKFFKGEENYLLPAPIVRRTTRSDTPPTFAGCGFIDAPPAGPDGYEWLKTADRGVRQGINGKWERVEEWTGAEDWDDDFYPPPS